MGIIFRRENAKVKKPEHIKKNIFIIFSPRTVTVETATCSKIDTNITLILPKKGKAFSTSKFMGYEIYQIKAKQERSWIEILNRSYEEDLKIKKKNSILGFLVIEPENLSFKHETKSTKKKEAITKNVGRVDQKNEENKKTLSIRQQK